jgi:hypothetical protein
LVGGEHTGTRFLIVGHHLDGIGHGVGIETTVLLRRLGVHATGWIRMATLLRIAAGHLVVAGLLTGILLKIGHKG